jgi:hypothetical protein
MNTVRRIKMFDTLSLADIDGQHVQLLPARTVMSLFTAGGGGGGTNHCSQSNGNFTQSGMLDVAALNNVNANVLGQTLQHTIDVIPISVLSSSNNC